MPMSLLKTVELADQLSEAMFSACQIVQLSAAVAMSRDNVSVTSFPALLVSKTVSITTSLT
jgi:hypothetical protein